MVCRSQRAERGNCAAGSSCCPLGLQDGKISGISADVSGLYRADVCHRDKAYLLFYLHIGGSLSVPVCVEFEKEMLALRAAACGTCGACFRVSGTVSHAGPGEPVKLCLGHLQQAGK